MIPRNTAQTEGIYRKAIIQFICRLYLEISLKIFSSVEVSLYKYLYFSFDRAVTKCPNVKICTYELYDWLISCVHRNVKSKRSNL